MALCNSKYGPAKQETFCPTGRLTDQQCFLRSAIVAAITVCQQNLFTFVPVRAFATAVWLDGGTIDVNMGTSWNVYLPGTSNPVATTWNDNGSLGTTKETAWNVDATDPILAVTTSWNDTVKTAVTSNTIWNDESEVPGLSVVTSWNDSAGTNVTCQTSWNDNTTVNQQSDSEWNDLHSDSGPTTLNSIPVGPPGGQECQVYIVDITNNYLLVDVDSDVTTNFPASCTKMMTVLLCIEYHQDDFTTGTVTITSDDENNPYPGITLSTAGYQVGDVMTWEDCCYGCMLPSGYDACQCIARNIGNELYAAAGNTGTQGMPRFIERMNERAVELGINNAIYFDPFGGSQQGTTIRNVLSPKMLGTAFMQAMTHPELQTICGSIQHDVTITGPNARTQTLTNVVPFINGPTLNPSLIKTEGVIAAKSGDWTGDKNYHNIVMLWEAPAGQQIAITTVGSVDQYSVSLDVRGIMNMLPVLFPYLGESDTESDPSWLSVKVLAAVDSGEFEDQSPVHRTLEVSATVAPPINFDGTGSIEFVNNSDGITVPDSPDIESSSDDMTIEMWYTGNGTTPGGEYIFFGKLGVGTEREYAINDYSGQIGLFVSSDGSSWQSTETVNINSGVFHNGAPHHICLVKGSGVWAVYIDGERMVNTLSVSSAANTPSDLTVGLPIASEAPLGKVEEFRVTMGVARYSDNMVTMYNRKYPRSGGVIG